MELELGKPCPWCGEGSMVFDGGAVGYFCDRGFKCKQPSPWNDDPAIGAMEEFAAPKHLRKGQALFVFINWLGANRKVPQLAAERVDRDPGHTHFLLGDTFNVPDDQLAKWWDEWVMSLEKAK